MSEVPHDLDSSKPSDEIYQRTIESAGMIDRSERVRITVSGPDRAKFLHNLTTNEVKKLSACRGREAFVTSPQGKTLGFISIHALETSLIVRADAAAFDLLTPHFRKYGLFDEIQIDDEQGHSFEFHVAGPRVDDLFGLLCQLSLPTDEYGIVEFELESSQILGIRESPTGRPGFTIIGPVEAKSKVHKRLIEAGRSLGLIEIDQSTFDTLRIEAGTPIFGRDLTEKNLPQELRRDARAISFVKGCYLGQETVARIDALGHVNQSLRGFRSRSPRERLEPGDSLRAEGKVIGYLTSASFSPGWDSWIALGYIRESALESQVHMDGYRDDVKIADGLIIQDLPMLPLREF